MTTVHLVYPHRERISAPHSIGRKLGDRLRERGYEVLNYNIDEPRRIRPGGDDVLLGHPHEAPWSVFRRSAARRGWRRRLMLMPYVHVDTYHVALADPVIRNCDLFLALTGRYWFDRVAESVAAHWQPKMVHVDLAVDPGDFPRVKSCFAEPGRRRFLYVGHTGWYKNTPYLSELARRIAGTDFAWIGGGDGEIPGLRPLGRQDFATESGRALAAEYDFLITVGSGDANPATILESMSWGLIPVCTPQSGYVGYPGIVNVPLDDAEGAVEILHRLQDAPTGELLSLRSANDEALTNYFTWDRFAEQIVEAIESTASPPLDPLPRTASWRIHALSLRSEASVLAPSKFRPTLRELASATSAGRAALAVQRRLRGL